MQLSVADAQTLMEARKRLLNIPPWTRRLSRDKKEIQIGLEARVSLKGVMPRGLWFRIVRWAQYPDTAVIQLECDIPGSRSHLPLYRLEWRPMTAHQNGNVGPEELRWQFFAVGETHEHSCHYNIEAAGLFIMSRGVQAAKRIDPDFNTFEESLAHACDILNIENGGEILTAVLQQELEL